MSRRTGFTLIELLIVIAIIGILIALIAVAVTKAKELAVRARCQQHLNQIGAAFHTHETQFGYFPCSTSTKPQRSVFTPLLGFVGQEPLRKMFDLKKDWWTASPDAYGAPVGVFFCPAAPPGDQGQRMDTTTETSSSGKTIYTTKPRACTDYAALTAVGSKLKDHCPTVDDLGVGALYNNPAGLVRPEAIFDGLTNTIFLTEVAGRPQLWLNGNLRSGSVPGAGWASHRLDFALDGKDPNNPTQAGPCLINCSNDNEIYSFHSGGANFLFGDRSVRFLGVHIAPQALARFISREGNLPPNWSDW